MTEEQSTRILKALFHGLDPTTGEELPPDSFIHSTEVVRALGDAIHSMTKLHGKKSAVDTSTLSKEQLEKFEALRRWRFEKASEEGVPAYVVAHNKHLLAMAVCNELDTTGLAGIPGFGEAKAAKYGTSIIKCLLNTQPLNSNGRGDS